MIFLPKSLSFALGKTSPPILEKKVKASGEGVELANLGFQGKDSPHMDLRECVELLNANEAESIIFLENA